MNNQALALDKVLKDHVSTLRGLVGNYQNGIKKIRKTRVCFRELPESLFEHATTFWTYDYNCLYVAMYYNLSWISKIIADLEALGYTSPTDLTKPVEYISAYFRSTDPNKPLQINLTVSNPIMKAKGEDVCVLIPIQWESEMKVKVTAYDRVCPKEHPEMFNENGEYIGWDKVFPKPPDYVLR